MQGESDNALRYNPLSKKAFHRFVGWTKRAFFASGPPTKGHVESYFIRANHPSKPLAFWIKATILSPLSGPPIAEKWCIVFDGENQRIFSEKESFPFCEASFAGDSPRIEMKDFFLVPTLCEGTSVKACRVDKANCRVDKASEASGPPILEPGETRGQVKECNFQVSWKNQAPSTLGKPLCLYPSRRWVDSFFPASKLLTPFPTLCFNGTLHVFGREISIQNWLGMQGHNWGLKHPEEYAWGQCIFVNPVGEPECMVEGFTGRVRIAGVMTPWLSSVVVRDRAREYRFDRLWDFWRQHSSLSRLRERVGVRGEYTWKVSLSNKTAKMELEMSSPTTSFAELLYINPDGKASYCFNSKLSQARIRVNPVDEAPFEYITPHGGALEFLKPRDCV